MIYILSGVRGVVSLHMFVIFIKYGNISIFYITNFVVWYIYIRHKTDLRTILRLSSISYIDNMSNRHDK